jgi:hypothetical protein
MIKISWFFVSQCLATENIEESLGEETYSITISCCRNLPLRILRSTPLISSHPDKSNNGKLHSKNWVLKIYAYNYKIISLLCKG